jgi:hypothetical protein
MSLQSRTLHGLRPTDLSSYVLHRPSSSGLAFWGPGDFYRFLITGAESGGAYFAGDFVNVPRGTVHRFSNASAARARLILTFTPAGIEKFFEETLERAKDPEQAPPDNLDEVAARYAEAAPRYGMEFLVA